MWGPWSVPYNQVIQLLEQLADILIVVDHDVAVLGPPPPGLSPAPRLGVGAKVHVGSIPPHKERRVCIVRPVDEIKGCGSSLIVDGFHALFIQRVQF